MQQQRYIEELKNAKVVEICNFIDGIRRVSFVKLRNNKTHSGTVEWGESANIYAPLFAIVYASFFKYIELPDEVIKSTLLQIF